MRAKALFLVEKLNISQIAGVVGISRQTVSKYIHSLPEYETEAENRKSENRMKRSEYKREWQRHKRNTVSMSVTADTLRRDHETAVAVLSHEKYH